MLVVLEIDSKGVELLDVGVMKSSFSSLDCLAIGCQETLLSLDVVGDGLLHIGNVHGFVFSSLGPCSNILLLSKHNHLWHHIRLGTDHVHLFAVLVHDCRIIFEKLQSKIFKIEEHFAMR